MTHPNTIPPLTQQQLVDGFRQTGLQHGDVVLIHSVMRTFGPIQGGAQTVVAALLEVLGPTGTLVAPTFTAVPQPENEMVINPRTDPSQMGAISEAVRTHPNASRSTAYRHSVAAIGRRAHVITQVDPALSAFDLRSAFGVMLALNTHVLLCGVTYASSTTHHFAEWICDVPYRKVVPKTANLKLADGRIITQPMTDYGSNYAQWRPDFNRLGQLLEDHRKVSVTQLGNAMLRRFSMRDFIDLAQAQAVNDIINIFRTIEENGSDTTPLSAGQTILSPQRLSAAGRPARYQWSVGDETQLNQEIL